MSASSSRFFSGEECLIDSGSTNTILQHAKFFSELKPTQKAVGTISGDSNIIEGYGIAHITLSSDIDIYSIMGGCSMGDFLEGKSTQTLVLVGKSGNGKSATGNIILGLKKFKSKRSPSSVTITSELQTAELNDGRILNVIDTPGLFDSSLKFEFIGKEIVNCINMAKDGMHAFLVVVSARRFSEDEKAAISSLRSLFGRKIYDYMIVIFTGGDELEEDGETLEDFLHDSPEPLKETLSLCGNRCVLFNNKTEDEAKRSNQLSNLLFMVKEVSQKNGGKPYTSELFIEMKVELKVEEVNSKLKQLFIKEQAARTQAEEIVKAAEKKLNEEIREMRDVKEVGEGEKIVLF